MALDPPFVVRVEKQPGGTFGETMNNIRSWLDYRHIKPASFNPVANARSGVGFKISFNSENEAHLFEQEFHGRRSIALGIRVRRSAAPRRSP